MTQPPITVQHRVLFFSSAEIAGGIPLTVKYAKCTIDPIAEWPGHVREEDIAMLTAAGFNSADYVEPQSAFTDEAEGGVCEPLSLGGRVKSGHGE